MTQQTRSTGSAPHEDKERSSPHKGGAQAREAEGDGPVKPGLTSDEQPDLVPPSGINERDHGAADDKPMGGGPVNFDDDDELRPRGNTARSGGTWQAQGGDAGELGQSPGAGLSDRAERPRCEAPCTPATLSASSCIARVLQHRRRQADRPHEGRLPRVSGTPHRRQQEVS